MVLINEHMPENYPVYKQILAKVVADLCGIIIFPRDNLLSDEDTKKAHKVLQRGDIILFGNLRTIFSSIMNAPVTHAALVVNKRKVIHATREGIVYDSTAKLFVNYDTMIILRPEENKYRKKLTKRAISIAKKCIGIPYNFFFEEDQKDNSFFCSKFVNDCYIKAGYDTKINSFNDVKLFNKIAIKKGIKPIEITKGNFNIKFMSHNLTYVNSSIKFKETDKNIESMLKMLRIYRLNKNFRDKMKSIRFKVKDNVFKIKNPGSNK